MEINEMLDALKQDENLKTELLNNLGIKTLPENSDFNKIDEPDILRQGIAKLRDENAKTRVKYSEQIDTLQANIDNLQKQLQERASKEQEIEESKLKEEGKYQELLETKENELKLKIDRLTALETEVNLYRKKEQMEKESLLEKIPDEKKEVFKDASIPIIKEYLSTLEITKDSPRSGDKPKQDAIPNSYDDYILLNDEQKNQFAAKYPDILDKLYDKRYKEK